MLRYEKLFNNTPWKFHRVATQEEMEELRQKYNISTYNDNPFKRPVNKGGRANSFRKKYGID